MNARTATVFGSAVSTAGDVNGDGFDDLIIGDYRQGSDYLPGGYVWDDYLGDVPVHGRAFVYYGSATGLTAGFYTFDGLNTYQQDFSWTVSGRAGGQDLGHAVGTAGDVIGGDGIDDIIVGAHGKVYIFSIGTNLPPTITSTSPITEISVGEAFTYVVSAADPDVYDEVSFNLFGEPDGMLIDELTGLVTWVPDEDSRGESVSPAIYVADMGGEQAAQYFTLYIKDIESPPEITPIPDQTIATQELFTCRVSAQDANDDDLSFSLSQTPEGMKIGEESGQIGWTPTPAQVGVHNIKVRVTDSTGLSNTTAFSISVTPFHAPVIVSTPKTKATLGITYTYQIIVQDEDAGDIHTLSLEQAPSGMDIDTSTGLITWKPEGVHLWESYEITVRAVDLAGLSAIQTFTLIVNANTAPTITSTPPTTAREGHAYTYQVIAYDLENGRLIFSLDHAPLGMNIEAPTGLITWTPTGTYPNQQFSVTVRVADEGGLSDTQPFTIAIENTRPVIVSTPPTMGRVEHPYIYLVKAEDPGDTLTYTLTRAPVSMTIDSLNGLIQWIPPDVQYKHYAVDVRVEDAGGLHDNQYFSIVVPSASATDDDGDGFTEEQNDCDDTNPFISPGAMDIPSNDIDENCDGQDADPNSTSFYPLSAYPDAISVSVPTTVTFNIRLLDPTVRPEQVLLLEIDTLSNTTSLIGELKDDAIDGTQVANDGVYAGAFTIISETEGIRYFQAMATFSGTITPTYSSLYGLNITRFSTQVHPSDMSKIAIDPTNGAEIISNEVLVVFAYGTPLEAVIRIINAIGGSVMGAIHGLNIYQVEIPDTGDALGVYDAISKLGDEPLVIYAEPNSVGHIASVETDDPFFGPLPGQQPELFDINAPEAWVVARGVSDHTPIVAVVDTGVKYDHEDLAGTVFSQGWNILGHNDPGPNDTSITSTHGTKVAGVIAARQNNKKGGAGICWGCKIFAANVYSDSNGTTSIATASGIYYSAENNARIINCSFSSRVPYYSTIQHLVIKYATYLKDALVVVAAGNKHTSTLTHPPAYPETFVVGATTTSTDYRAWFSNYGTSVDIAAPGTYIHVPSYYGTHKIDSYDNVAGTSFSAPMVSAAAAIIWAQHPDWHAQQIRERLEQTAKPLPQGIVLGAGKLDIFEAVFDGSFEVPGGSTYVGTTVGAGNVQPTDRERMLYVQTQDVIALTYRRAFEVLPDVDKLSISFDYKLVHIVPPDGTPWNHIEFLLYTPSGLYPHVCQVFYNNLDMEADGNAVLVDAEALDQVEPFQPVKDERPPGDWRMSGWKSASCTIDTAAYGGVGEYKFVVNAWGFEWSTAMVDHLRFFDPVPIPPPSNGSISIIFPPHNPYPSDATFATNFSFLSNSVINAQAVLTPTGGESDIEWEITAINPASGDIMNVSPSNRRGPSISFTPNPPSPLTYKAGNGCANPGNGSCARNIPLSYQIKAIYDGNSAEVTITQDQIDTIRQEYLDHGLSIPARDDFHEPSPATNFSVQEVMQFTAYAVILGDPGQLAQQVRDAYNLLINDDVQMVLTSTTNLSPATVVVSPGSSIQGIGPILDTEPCHGAPIPAMCDDVISGTAIIAGPNGIAETVALNQVTNYGLKINSAWRNPERNEAVGGVLNSRHQLGNAVDLDIVLPVPGKSPAQLFCILQTAANSIPGVNGFAEHYGSQRLCNATDVTHVHAQR